MSTLLGALEDFTNAISEAYQEGMEEFKEYDEQEYDRFNSIEADSRRMILLEEILYSDEAYELGIMLIAQNQLWENQIDRYGRPLPLYKPRTIRYKIKRGVPAEKRVRYTEFDTGAFYNEGINIEVNRANDFFDFYNTHAKGYFDYIPDSVIGLTQENEEYFKWQIGEWLQERLMQDWLNNEG